MSHNGVVPPEARTYYHEDGPYLAYPNRYAVSPQRAEALKREWRAIAHLHQLLETGAYA